MKRRFLSLLLTLLTVFSLASSVSADMIWTPDDSFFEKHYQECDYVGRSYQLAGYDGTVTVFTAPGGAGKDTLDNGIQGIIQFTWEGRGISWGYLCRVTGADAEGWVAMDDLAPVYDSQQFSEDHSEEIQEVEWGQEVPVEFREAVRYSYPNGTTSGAVLKENPDYLPFSQALRGLYTDESGLRWGYIDYYMSSRNIWVCLDDPMNGGMDTGIVPVSPSPAQIRGSATVGAGASALPLAAGLVAAVTAATALLILKLRKRSAPDVQTRPDT